MTYEDYLKLVQSNMLDANGRFRGPDAGVNYQAEGMTPQEFYDFMNQQVGDQNARDGADAGPQARGVADPRWQPGVVSTKAGLLGNWGVPLAMIAAPYAASALGLGSSPTLGAEFNAVSTPVVGHTAGVTTTNLAPLGAASGGLLDTVKQWVGDNPTLMKLAGAALGAAASGDTKTSTTSSKDPWAPAQPYLLQNLAQNQAMSDHYNANPFSQEQQNAYQGLLNTVANSQAAGNGLLSMAQNFGRSSHGVMPQFGPLGSAQAPAINWSQYQNIGRK